MVLKVGEGHKVNCIHITAMGFQYHGEFRNEAWDEDVKIQDSYTSLTHAIEPYLLTITAFFSVMATFEIIHR